MGNPTQIGSIGLGANAGGSMLSAFGSLMKGSAESDMYGYQAGVARLRQQLDLQNQEFAVQTGEQQALKTGLEQKAKMGQIVGAQAASGLDVRSGSAAAVRASQTGLNTIDTGIIRSNAAKTAYNFAVQGAAEGAQANMYTSAAANATTAGQLGFASSILGGVGSVSKMWLQGGQVDLFGSGSGTDTSSNSGLT